MTARHTPGPWEERGDEVIAVGAEPRVVCIVPPVRGCLANARLIAAAPDLHESLDALSGHFGIIVCQASTDGKPELNRLIADAYAALAKARGQ